MLGLDSLRAIKADVVLYTSFAIALSSEISMLIQCNLNQAEIKIHTIYLYIEIRIDPRFPKAKPMAFGLHGVVQKNLQDLLNEGVVRTIPSSL